MAASHHPAPDEFAAFYAGYVARIGDGEDVLAVLAAQLDEVRAPLGQRAYLRRPRAAVRPGRSGAAADVRRERPEVAWSRRGMASGNTVSVRALAYIVAGHVRHHLAVLEERYLS